MQLGLFNLMSYRDTSQSQTDIYRNTIELVCLAEQAGFDAAWFGEHHFSNYCMCPSPLMMAALCAGKTTKIKLAPGVLVLPLYEPVRLLGEIAMVDRMSEGRLIVGLGSGYQEFEFERFGVELSNSVGMFTEMLDIIELGLSNDVIEYQGKHYQIPETPLAVRPTNAQPEIYVAGLARAEAVQVRMAKSGYAPLVGAGTKGLALLKEHRAAVEGYYQTAGLDPSQALFGFQNYVHISDQHQEALDAADNFRWVARVVASMRGKYQELDGTILKEFPAEGEASLEDAVSNTCLGPPEVVAEKMVEQIRSLKPLHMTCFMQPGSMPHARAMRSLERFAEEVIPMVEKEVGALAEVGIREANVA